MDTLPPPPVEGGSPMVLGPLDGFRNANTELILKAAKAGNKKALRKLKEKGAIDNVDVKNSAGQTALFIACFEEHDDCVQYLLELGANANEASENGQTPLHAACFKGSIKAVSAMIEHGGDFRFHDKDQRTAKDWAMMNPNPKKRQTMIEYIVKTRMFAMTNSGRDVLLERQDSLYLRRPTAESGSLAKLFSLRRSSRRDSAGVAKVTSFMSLGYGKVYGGTRGGTVSFVPVVAEAMLRHDEHATTFVNGAFFVMESMTMGHTRVTVKRLHHSPPRGGIVDHLITECDNIGHLRHPNILLLMATCYTDNMEGLVLVFERIQFGSLYSYLHDRSQQPQPNASIEASLQIAEGLVYIHQSGFLHCALTSHAMFLTSPNTVKIGNFEYMVPMSNSGVGLRHSGVSQNKYLHAVYNWLAPEVISGELPSEKSDLYSFCCIMWEIFTAFIPWSGHDADQITHQVCQGKKMLCVNDPRLPPKLSDVLTYGLQPNPSNRKMTLEHVRDVLYLLPRGKLKHGHGQSSKANMNPSMSAAQINNHCSSGNSPAIASDPDLTIERYQYVSTPSCQPEWPHGSWDENCASPFVRFRLESDEDDRAGLLDTSTSTLTGAPERYSRSKRSTVDQSEQSASCQESTRPLKASRQDASHKAVSKISAITAKSGRRVETPSAVIVSETEYSDTFLCGGNYSALPSNHKTPNISSSSLYDSDAIKPASHSTQKDASSRSTVVDLIDASRPVNRSRGTPESTGRRHEHQPVEKSIDRSMAATTESSSSATSSPADLRTAVQTLGKHISTTCAPPRLASGQTRTTESHMPMRRSRPETAGQSKQRQSSNVELVLEDHNRTLLHRGGTASRNSTVTHISTSDNSGANAVRPSTANNKKSVHLASDLVKVEVPPSTRTLTLPITNGQGHLSVSSSQCEPARHRVAKRRSKSAESVRHSDAAGIVDGCLPWNDCHDEIVRLPVSQLVTIFQSAKTANAETDIGQLAALPVESPHQRDSGSVTAKKVSHPANDCGSSKLSRSRGHHLENDATATTAGRSVHSHNRACQTTPTARPRTRTTATSPDTMRTPIIAPGRRPASIPCGRLAFAAAAASQVHPSPKSESHPLPSHDAHTKGLPADCNGRQRSAGVDTTPGRGDSCISRYLPAGSASSRSPAERVARACSIEATMAAAAVPSARTERVQNACATDQLSSADYLNNAVKFEQIAPSVSSKIGGRKLKRLASDMIVTPTRASSTSAAAPSAAFEGGAHDRRTDRAPPPLDMALWASHRDDAAAGSSVSLACEALLPVMTTPPDTTMEHSSCSATLSRNVSGSKRVLTRSLSLRESCRRSAASAAAVTFDLVPTMARAAAVTAEDIQWVASSVVATTLDSAPPSTLGIADEASTYATPDESPNEVTSSPANCSRSLAGSGIGSDELSSDSCATTAAIAAAPWRSLEAAASQDLAREGVAPREEYQRTNYSVPGHPSVDASADKLEAIESRVLSFDDSDFATTASTWTGSSADVAMLSNGVLGHVAALSSDHLASRPPHAMGAAALSMQKGSSSDLQSIHRDLVNSTREPSQAAVCNLVVPVETESLSGGESVPLTAPESVASKMAKHGSHEKDGLVRAGSSRPTQHSESSALHGDIVDSSTVANISCTSIVISCDATASGCSNATAVKARLFIIRDGQPLKPEPCIIVEKPVPSTDSAVLRTMSSAATGPASGIQPSTMEIISSAGVTSSLSSASDSSALNTAPAAFQPEASGVLPSDDQPPEITSESEDEYLDLPCFK